MITERPEYDPAQIVALNQLRNLATAMLAHRGPATADRVQLWAVSLEHHLEALGADFSPPWDDRQLCLTGLAL